MIAALLLLAGLVLVGLSLRSGITARLQVDRRLGRLVMRAGTVVAEEEDGWHLPPELEAWCERAGLEPSRLPLVLLLSGGLPAGLSLLLLPAWYALLLAALGAGLAVLVLRIRVERRGKAIRDLLPGFLDRLRQQVAIGASASQGLERAVLGSPDLLREVFAPVLWRLRHGATLGETLVWLAHREKSPELGSFASAIAASSRFGGRLSEPLGNLARTQRDRQRVEREMKAATAEVRASAFVLALLPLGVAGGLAMISDLFRSHFGPDGPGTWLLPWLAAVYFVGVLLLRRIARPRF